MKKTDVIVEQIENVRFTGKRNPIEGILSVMIGITSAVAFLVLCIFATIYDGKGDTWIGTVGCLSCLCNVAALILAIKAMKKENIYYKLPTLGIIFNGIAIIGYMILYLWGALA